ncbi:hypothetical protein SVIO_043800 [Streptomyces violaceusniger]|uniref:Uncharacterized protein n=1 Tax=Streptomyces violaceusniger TaxID=68280 RepID=A0A4D4L515_STRVO|nr:hypothetical protein SVIO_043800 [Streptomyces violaceusniger]
MRAVDRGDADPVLAPGEQRQHLVLRGPHRDHRATLGKLPHQPPTGGDQGGGVLQGEHTRHMGGRELADGVSGEQFGAQPPGLEEAVERDLDGEQGGLGVVGAVQEGGLGAALLGEEHVEEREFQLLLEVPAGVVEGFGEDGVGGVELAAHAEALAALSGEEQGELSGDGCAAHDGRPVAPVGEGTQGGAEAVAVTGEEHGALLEGGAGGGQGVADVGEGEAGVGLQQRVQPLGLALEGVGGLRGQRPGQHGGFRGTLAVGLLGLAALLLAVGRGLLDDGVRVGAAHAERRDARAARAVALRPGPRLGQQLDVTGGPVDMRGRLVHVQRPRQHPVAHRHDHLDDAADTGRGLGVADVGLERAEPQRAVRLAVPAVGGEQRLGLDGVAQCRTGAVGLDRVDLAGRQSGVGEGLADDALLGGAAGGGEAVAGAVLVDGGGADDGEDPVTVSAGVREPFDEQHADALAPRGAVGRGGERLAAAVGREPALAAEGDERAGVGHDRGATGERHGALARAQRLHGQVERHQGGGAGGVDGDGGAFEAEGVGDAAGGDAGGVAGDQIALEALLGLVQPGSVVLGLGADEHTGPAAPEERGVDTGAFEDLPGGLQQQPLLRIHRQRLARGDSEERRVELIGVVQESAFAGIAAARPVGVGVVKPGEIPAPTHREFGDDVLSARDDFPQFFGGSDLAGEPAAHSDNGDGLVGGDRAHSGVGRNGVGVAVPAEQFGPHMAGEVGGGGVVEGEGDRQPQPGGGGQPGVQIDRGEGVEAQVEEGTLGVEDVRRLVLEGLFDDLADPGGEGFGALGLGERGEPVAPWGRPFGARAPLFGVLGREIHGLTHHRAPHYPRRHNTKTVRQLYTGQGDQKPLQTPYGPLSSLWGPVSEGHGAMAIVNSPECMRIPVATRISSK